MLSLLAHWHVFPFPTVTWDSSKPLFFLLDQLVTKPAHVLWKHNTAVLLCLLIALRSGFPCNRDANSKLGGWTIFCFCFKEAPSTSPLCFTHLWRAFSLFALYTSSERIRCSCTYKHVTSSKAVLTSPNHAGFCCFQLLGHVWLVSCRCKRAGQFSTFLQC